jgi:hypothetical protein
MNNQLKDEIESIRNRLNELEKQLNNQEPLTINNANIGDVIEGGWIVGHKEARTAILVAPKCYEKKLKWVDIEKSINCPKLFIPSIEIFSLVFSNLCNVNKTLEVFETCKGYWVSSQTIVKTSQHIVTSSGSFTGPYDEAYARPFNLVCF